MPTSLYVLAVNPFDLTGRYFWLLGLIATGYSYFSGNRAVADLDLSDPRRSEEARALRFQFAAWSALPWVVMGVGEMVGGVPSIWYYFRPQDGDPYVLTWFASLFLESLVFAFWIFSRGGAEKMIELQPLNFNSRRGTFKLTVRSAKLFAALGPFWIALWTALAVFMNVPIAR
jgi:hypothetical protein